MAETWRARAARGMRRYFERRRWPRLSLGLVMVFTGLSGFGISYVLLRLGMDAMWQRYPLAVLGAYAVFLLLLRLWVEIERATFDPEDPEVLAALEAGAREPTTKSTKKDSWLDWLDIPDIGGVDSAEGCAVGILIAAALGLIVVMVTMVAGAPVLIGEVAMDVFLVSILYRRLKAAEREHWLAAAVRQTWMHVLAAAALLAIIGGCLDMLAPGADTLGEAIRQWRTGSPPDLLPER
jgi:hypothetical protein